MKFIIQAGGLGTRLKNLTDSKPKGLVSAKYLPIIFHLFKQFPTDEFIIIGDYRFDILDHYLATFAQNVNYILLKSTTRGNIAGIKEALDYILPDEPFTIIWSDIILSPQFSISHLLPGCQIGIVDFPCSWSFVDGQLEHKSVPYHGVAGLFVFNNKKRLANLPAEGSLTDFLKESDIPLYPLSLMGSIDVGTLEAYNKIAVTKNKSRPYNKIDFVGNRVVKTGLTDEAIKMIAREVKWYNWINTHNFNNAPRIIESSPFTMEFIDGINVFLSPHDKKLRRKILSNIFTALGSLHSLQKTQPNNFDLYREYFSKTIARLLSIASALPLANLDFITINGQKCANVIVSPHILREAVTSTLIGNTFFAPIHGDCQFTNILVNQAGEPYFIDPRGYFGKSEILGDIRYDWAKVYYSLMGNFDQFNIGNHTLKLKDNEVEYSIGSGGWEYLLQDFYDLLPPEEGTANELELIHAIIWLSMASHAWDDFDSMCIAFYNGTLLFDQWRRKVARPA